METVEKDYSFPQGFDEALQSEKLDPLFNGFETIDFDAIDAEDFELEGDMERLSDLLKDLLLWLVDGNRDHHSYGRYVFHKALMMAWVIRPELLDSMTLGSIAKLNGVQSSKAALSAHAVSFSDRFNIKNRAMHSKKARRAFRRAVRSKIEGIRFDS